MFKFLAPLYAVVLFSQIATAQFVDGQTEHFNPVIERSRQAELFETVPDPDWNREFQDKFSIVRIKVFPHNSKYNAPQGKDTIIDKLKIASSGDCKVFKSVGATSAEPISRGTVLQAGKSFDFSAKTLSNPVWIECTGPIEVVRPDFASNPIKYAGLIFLKKAGTAAAPYLTAVNVLPFETYLKGVVPSEMPASWSFEALKAQAIAARSYAYYELGTEVFRQDPNIMLEQSGAQIDDTVTYQAYLGLKNGTAATNKAIDETAGRVMIFDGKVIKAYFHADSGGYTENAENVWGKHHPYILAKEELYPDGSIPGSQWSYTPSFNEVETKLTTNNFIRPGQKVSNLKVAPTDIFPSGRPEFVTIVFSDRTEKKILAVDFSFAMRIKSQWVRFSDIRPSAITIHGRGFGHGAGMNQWGARVMVDKLNKNFEDVLKFYYSGIQITE
jgi:stage II sporulation protein D